MAVTDSHQPLIVGKDAELGGSINEKAIVRKLNKHILLKFFLMCILCYIDRTNLAFAALQLNKTLGFSEQVYGLGSSIFFISYAGLQIPSNLMLVKLGGPRWLSIIIVSWGVVATAFAGMRNVFHFYLLRLLLGATESGTFPVFGAPLAALLLSLDGMGGLRGWQWLFIVEGLPTILLGFWINRCLAPNPLQATFLKQEEAEWLHKRQQLAKPSMGGTLSAEPGAWGAVYSWKTWYLAIVALLEALVKNSIIYWCPLIIASMVGHEHAQSQGRLMLEVLDSPPPIERGGNTTMAAISEAVKSVAAAPALAHVARINEHAATDYSGAVVAMLTALPFGSAALIMLFMAKHSASTGERKYHAFVPFVIATLALGTMSALIDTNPATAFLAMLCATVLWGPAGIISALPATFLSGPAAAMGVALINSIANIGGMLGPFMIGALRHSTDSYRWPIAVLACVTALTAVMVWHFPMERLHNDARQPIKKGSVAE